ncbi:TVG1359071 [Thermoplasma volcanium GSS1]|uniref:TVG1359071 protein n=1 Tax=Thermoplasma volcanium (strain ATCC 51530 / DSM 4299 / JCM 9571 / NBRC 15438 / GSS1) TaxID=273116 RepID=Q978U7_THEVO|nr:hypothetical protein [Thermoplasma volcanium]BAB60460.1 TVG1359071 [Thermoplasma volcanium GSS1]
MKRQQFEKRGFSDRGEFQKREKKLDMSRSEEFGYMLGKTVEGLPDSVRGAIRGTIYSLASKKGIKEAKEFIGRKYQEGVIDYDTQKKLINLIYDYSKYR